MQPSRLSTASLLFVACALLPACGRPLVKSGTVTQIVQGSAPTTRGFITVAFGTKPDTAPLLSAAVDWNRDGTFAADEWIVRNAPALPRADWNGNFPVVFPRATDLDGLKARIVTSDGRLSNDALADAEGVDLTLGHATQDIGDILDLSTVTKPEASMKGDTVERPNTGAPAPKKDEGVPDTFHNDTPDITQRKDECAPTAAANSFIRLAGDNNRIDAIPRDPQELIDLFKKEMGWTPQNGVLIEDFSVGKDYVAKQLGLPISSETISGDFGHVIDKMEEAINAGGAAELRIQSQVTDAKGKVHNVGGHMITVVGVVRNGQSVSLQVHDSLSPAGTETYEIDANDGALINYPYLGGKESDAVRVRVTTGFLQHWTGDQPPSILDDIEPQQRATIKVIDVGGHKVPLSEVKVEGPGQCPADHYHASRNGAVRALDGQMIPDSAPLHCGFGKVADVPVEDCTQDGKTCTPAKMPAKK